MIGACDVCGNAHEECECAERLEAARATLDACNAEARARTASKRDRCSILIRLSRVQRAELATYARRNGVSQGAAVLLALRYARVIGG